MFLFYDTESTDLPPKKSNYTETYHYPFMIELGAILVDKDWQEVEAFESLVSPSEAPQWEIAEGAQQAHGISREQCEAEGKPIRQVLRQFHRMLKLCERQGAFNIAFDVQLIQAEYVRLSADPKILGVVPQHCIMLPCTNVCKLPGKFGFKWPKLAEAYLHFEGVEMQHAHRALADIRNAIVVAKHLHGLGLYPSPGS